MSGGLHSLLLAHRRVGAVRAEPQPQEVLPVLDVISIAGVLVLAGLTALTARAAAKR